MDERQDTTFGMFIKPEEDIQPLCDWLVQIGLGRRIYPQLIEDDHSELDRQVDIDDIQ